MPLLFTTLSFISSKRTSLSPSNLFEASALIKGIKSGLSFRVSVKIGASLSRDCVTFSSV
ncbi:MAG TPA: hypothetical protein PK449_03975 [Exilispira sp.]|nr:hypothetical protein [Exilispira sp.]HQJ40695.1 hypothetical protein [Exilispira sp.]